MRSAISARWCGVIDVFPFGDSSFGEIVAVVSFKYLSRLFFLWRCSTKEHHRPPWVIVHFLAAQHAPGRFKILRLSKFYTSSSSVAASMYGEGGFDLRSI